VETDHPFGWVLRVIQEEETTAEEFREALRLAVEHLERMPPEGRANWEKLMRFLLALIYHRREQLERAELLGIIETNVIERSRKEEVEKMGKTIAEALIEEGKELGKELGIIAAKQEDSIKLLRAKFDTLPQTLVERIRSIHEVKQLDALFDLAIAAKTIVEVESKPAEISTGTHRS